MIGAAQAFMAYICAFAVFATPVSAAQADGDRRIPTWKQSHLAENDTAIQALYILAVCVREARSDAARALLQTRPGTAEEGNAIAKVLPGGEDPCLLRVRKLRMSSSIVLRGAIAEAFYNGVKNRPLSGSPLPVGTSFLGLEPGAQGERAVAACAVAKSPALAHAVVQTHFGSPREMRALRALDATLLDCLPQDGVLRVSRIGFRALLAEALYHASRSSKGSFANA